ncbi:type I polyketide synthase [Actinoalloteichus hymeniacidonis]|uniref:Polyketide synthase family protein n=1 Tax=Actinoalloteichus hymeniacidonis TaxID=340345 RepID=A0AAC9HMZ5_9PSEU|nr:type I polyketide synthase [Actinoalloteichus hymeniacidonis]AOS62171.1 polyketide synthase family protein [Actinoalloteichus hymeniacidonis]MBB5909806.1 acyl transferase domain-containing protein/acyl carrier protein [Actinoalloteichus hymeniacidonis]
MADDRIADRELDIAIVGMAGRFPEARDVEELWANLLAGREAVRPIEDAEFLAAGGDPALLTDPAHLRLANAMPDLDCFDAEYFGFLPTEAALLDPQHRIFLETCQHALDDAGHDPDRVGGPVGVYAGSSQSEYYLSHVHPRFGGEYSIGSMAAKIANLPDALASRVSYALNLTGPAIAVQTACSTSLVAVHLACQDLLTSQCDLALAGGVGLIPDKLGYRYVDGGVYSPDGRCRPFDRNASGFIGGDGAGVVVLRRLADALADGDHIRAVIRGSAINNDGAAKSGFSAPSRAGQRAVILAAQANAEVHPSDIGYLEAHGTGTPVGDPIEVSALTDVFRADTRRRGFCALGSIKANLGHLDAASGIAGLIKAVLVIERGRIPPHPTFEAPNPALELDAGPFYVNTEAIAFPGDRPRRAGVSSFGIGGTNAHVILEQAPVRATAAAPETWTVLPVSARTRDQLTTVTGEIAEHLAARPELGLADVGHTLRSGRRSLPYRRTIVCRDHADAVTQLREPVPVDTAAVRPRPVVLLFGGGGAQYGGMGRELYETQPLFRAELDRCAEILRPVLGQDLRGLLYRGQRSNRPAGLAGLLSTQYALARLLIAAGVTPNAMLGHSLGEYTAACLSGVLGLSEVLPLMVERERLIRQAGGAMLSVVLTPEELAPYLTDRLSLAAVNAPRACSVSGPVEDIERLRAVLDANAVSNQGLDVVGAAHSWLLDPVLADYSAALSRVRLQAPTIPFVSNVTGDWITAEQARQPDFWLRHLRGTVRFADGLVTVAGEDDPIFIEVGPGSGLSQLAVKQLGRGTTVVRSVRSRKEDRPDSSVLFAALGRLWNEGIDLDWPAVFPAGRRIPLPGYPFERRRHWIDRVVHRATGEVPTGDSAAAPLAAPDRRDGSSIERPDDAARGDRGPVGGSPVGDGRVPATALSSRPRLTTPFRAPVTEHEKVVAAYWQSVLGIDPIGVDDGFFDLGGDSLLAVRMMDFVSNRFRVALPARLVFEQATVGEIVAAIAAAGVGDPRPVAGSGSDGDAPVTACP